MGEIEKINNTELLQFQEQGKRIKKKRQYILTTLYHAPMERTAHYMNCVQADY